MRRWQADAEPEEGCRTYLCIVKKLMTLVLLRTG